MADIAGYKQFKSTQSQMSCIKMTNVAGEIRNLEFFEIGITFTEGSLTLQSVLLNHWLSKLISNHRGKSFLKVQSLSITYVNFFNRSFPNSCNFLSTDPPRHPEIDGYREGEVIQMGDHLTLVCSSTGGKPRATLTWFRNGEALEGILSGSGRDSSSTLAFTVQETDNNAVYSCAASNPLTPKPLVTFVKLTVICK